MTPITLTVGHTWRLTEARAMADLLLPRASALVAVVAAALIGLSGCAPGSTTPASAPTPTAVSPPEFDTPPPIRPPTGAAAESQEAPVPSETNIIITMNGTTVRGMLQNNDASASLLAQLPLELSFQDYNEQEKIAAIPAPLSLDGMPSGGSAEPGTIGYYAPDQALVLYYETVDYFTGIIPIGTFIDVAAIRDSPAFVATVTATTGGTE